MVADRKPSPRYDETDDNSCSLSEGSVSSLQALSEPVAVHTGSVEPASTVVYESELLPIQEIAFSVQVEDTEALHF